MSKKQLSLKLVHLYPEEMNIYGDMGNIITLKRRLEWRGIEVEYLKIDHETDPKNLNGDIYFMGGGQDNDMYGVFEDLLENKKSWIKQEVEAGKVFLLICGAFQLFGRFFLDAKGRQIPGLDILPAETEAPGDSLHDRCLGNLVTILNDKVLEQIANYYPGEYEKTVVGFENHSGQTFIRDHSDIGIDVDATAQVIYGKGNNAKEKQEGLRYRNVFGSYTHGSYLPKNPHVADMLLGIALENKYQQKIVLEPLDDEVEWKAHKQAIESISGT